MTIAKGFGHPDTLRDRPVSIMLAVAACCSRGRHLLPNQQGAPTPFADGLKLFTGRDKYKSVKLLIDRFSPGNSTVYLSGPRIRGLLRGKRAIATAYEQLASLDLAALLTHNYL